MSSAEGMTMETLDAEAIRLQLDRMLLSQVFAASPRMAAFLRYVVESALSEDFAALKETCVGVAVFQRSPNYDPRADGIVRVEARRLRQKLREFYENEGQTDTWVVELPRGGYRPAFSFRPTVAIEEPQETTSLSVNEADLRPDLQPAEPGILPDEPRPKTSMPNRLRWWIVVGSLLVVALGDVGLRVRSRSARDTPRSVVTDAKSLTTYIGQEMQATTSPDGHSFAFVWDGDSGAYNIYVRNLDGGMPRQLTNGSGHHLYPAWSPDGRDIAYVNLDSKGLKLELQPSIGGSSRTVSEYLPLVSPWHQDARQITEAWSTSWTPDGTCLITNVIKENEAKDRVALFSIRLSGGSVQQVSHPPSGASDLEPAVSPDGKHVAFFRATSKQTGDVWVVDLEDGVSKQLTFDHSDIRGIAWTHDGNSLLYSGNREGAYSLQVISVESGKDTLIPTPGNNATEPVLTSDGNHVLYTDSQANSNIWESRLVAGKLISKPLRLISSSLSSHSARISPNGAQIAFVSNRSGHWEVWVSDAEGKNPFQVTHFAGPLVDAPHWSPDGSRLVFEARPKGRSAIFSVDVVTGRYTQLTTGKSNDKMPVWSHDGRWIYFNSDANGYAQIWKMHPDGSNPMLLSQQQGYDLVEERSGRYIYFLSGDQYLYRAPSGGGEAVRVEQTGRIGLSRYMDASNDALYYIRGESEPYRVNRFDFASGKVTSVLTIEDQILTSTPSLGVSGNGDFLLYTVLESGGSDIRMVTLVR